MTQNDSQPTALERDPVVVRALRSLTDRHVDQVLEALPPRAGGWIVDRHVDYDGYLCLVVTPAAGDATFLISGRPDRIELAQMQADRLHQIGCFDSIELAVRLLADRA